MKNFQEAADAWNTLVEGASKPAKKQETKKPAEPRKPAAPRDQNREKKDPDGLFQHGIYQVEATLQAHVCVRVGCIYVYPVQELLRQLDEWERDRALLQRRRRLPRGWKRPPLLRTMKVQVVVDGVERVTARGLLFPVELVPMRARYDIPRVWLMANEARLEPDDTSERGKIAIEAMQATFQRPDNIVYPPDHPKQMTGVDMVIDGVTIEVKYDLLGGTEEEGGSGNLFVQTHEINLKGKT